MNIYCPFTRSNPIMMSNLHNSTRRFNDASKLNKKKRQKKTYADLLSKVDIEGRYRRKIIIEIYLRHFR